MGGHRMDGNLLKSSVIQDWSLSELSLDESSFGSGLLASGVICDPTLSLLYNGQEGLCMPHLLLLRPVSLPLPAWFTLTVPARAQPLALTSPPFGEMLHLINNYCLVMTRPGLAKPSREYTQETFCEERMDQLMLLNKNHLKNYKWLNN